MSDVNKLDNKQCPFDPNQYQSTDVVVPIGSFPWALIQAYLGNTMYRKAWPKDMQITANANLLSLEVYGQYGNQNWISWQPQQDDIFSCDWAFYNSNP
ncbi:Thoeris anti-defense Tad2 family protein [Xenorhabdus stockiae]|uniref:Thoeris anti-defense Tad2 family protein n=1 Tax=Xenorhabdus stockiae TaxID=351614 RepID=UPI004063232D